MLEQGLNTVQRIGKQNTTAYPDTNDQVSAYEAVEAKRARSQETGEAQRKGFQIEKQFSTSSRELARTLGSFHKILEVLEREGSNQEAGTEPPPRTQKELFGSALPKRLNVSEQQSTEQNSLPENLSDERQLEFDFSPNDGATTKDIAVRSFDLEIKKFSTFEEAPDIDIGINPSRFKIQNIITDEIIKAISTSSNDLEIRNLGEPVATKLANHVRKLLEKQPHALATTSDKAPIKAFDTLI